MLMKINTETIVKDNNSAIRNKSVDVTLPLSDEDRDLLLDMYNYVKNSTDKEIAEKENLQPAVGISAIQVGIGKKMMAIVIKNSEGKIVYQYAMANPKIISESVEKAYLAGGEGCLSVPDEHEGYVYRARRIKVKGYDLLTDKEVVIKAQDYLAIVFQHELDHFKGILYYDHIDKEDPFHVKENAYCIE